MVWGPRAFEISRNSVVMLAEGVGVRWEGSLGIFMMWMMVLVEEIFLAFMAIPLFIFPSAFALHIGRLNPLYL